MKIGIDARLWNESGVGRYIRNLVFQLIKLDKKNEYVLFVQEKEVSSIKYQVSSASNRWRIVPVNIWWHTIAEQVLFFLILNKENLDLMHFPYFSVPILYNKPFIVTIHDLILHHFPTGEASTLPLPIYSIKLLGYRNIIHLAAKRAKRIITVSHATENELINALHVSPKKISVIYEGIEQTLLQKGKLKQSIHDPYFLYVGNAYPHKNLLRLIKSFSLLKEHLLPTKLYLVGGEDYFYRRLKLEVSKMGLTDMVIFFGKATDEELAFLYKNAKALIVPSLMEGFGLPLLEAMANNCLVLASDIPAHREIAAEAAIYFDPANATDLAEKIKSINLKKWQLFEDNRKRGINRTKLFSWEKMAKETLHIYESSISI